MGRAEPGMEGYLFRQKKNQREPVFTGITG
jgi:hypothetical protein